MLDQNIIKRSPLSGGDFFVQWLWIKELLGRGNGREKPINVIVSIKRSEIGVDNGDGVESGSAG